MRQQKKYHLRRTTHSLEAVQWVNGLGMDALLGVCSWKMRAIVWFGHDSGHRMLFWNRKDIVV